MVTAKEQFTSHAAPELLAAMRQIARADGMNFDDALENAMQEYIAAWERSHPGVRPDVMALYRDSLDRNRKLYELLAQAEKEL